MGLLRFILGILLILTMSLSGFATPATAASSAAIRAFDDVQPSTQNYAGQDLVRAEFSDAKLRGVDFSNADLTGAVFNGADLRAANLHGINFSDGIAYITNFAEADLTDGVFTSAMMLKSNFKNATVTGADFSYALLDREQVAHLCNSASGVNPTTGADTRESLGCR